MIRWKITPILKTEQEITMSIVATNTKIIKAYEDYDGCDIDVTAAELLGLR